MCILHTGYMQCSTHSIMWQISLVQSLVVTGFIHCTVVHANCIESTLVGFFSHFHLSSLVKVLIIRTCNLHYKKLFSLWTLWENHLRCFCWTLRTTSSLPLAVYVCIEPILAIFTFFAHSRYWSISPTFLQHRNSNGGLKCSLRFLFWASIKLMSVKVTNWRGGGWLRLALSEKEYHGCCWKILPTQA